MWVNLFDRCDCIQVQFFQSPLQFFIINYRIFVHNLFLAPSRSFPTDPNLVAHIAQLLQPILSRLLNIHVEYP